MPQYVFDYRACVLYCTKQLYLSLSASDGIRFFEPLGELVGVTVSGSGSGLSSCKRSWPEAHRSRRARELGGVVDWAAVAEFAVGARGIVLEPGSACPGGGLPDWRFDATSGASLSQYNVFTRRAYRGEKVDGSWNTVCRG